MYVLTQANEKYKGDVLLQKYYTSDFLSEKSVRNMGRCTDVQPFTCKVICGKCGAVYWRRTWTRGSRKSGCGSAGNATSGKAWRGVRAATFTKRTWRDGGLLHFHFLDGTVLEIETEE